MNNYMKTIISGLKQWVSSQKSDWNQNDSGAANFIKNRPFYSEEKEKVLFSGNIPVENFWDNVYGAENLAFNLSFVVGQTYKITFDNVEYLCECKLLNSGKIFGNTMIVGEGEETEEPFFIGYSDDWGLCLYCSAEGTHSLSISGTVEEVHQIDSKYVPIPDLADVAHTGNYWDLVDTPYIPWDTVQYATSQTIPNNNKQIARNNIGASSATNLLNGSSSFSLRTSNASQTIGNSSIAFGGEAEASGNYSHAIGYHTKASGNYSHAEGNNTKAFGVYSHAEGWHTTASGNGSHAEGYGAPAFGNYSHVEGYDTMASGDYSHAEGNGISTSIDFTGSAGAVEYTTSIANASVYKGYKFIYNGQLFTVINTNGSIITLDKTLSTTENIDKLALKAYKTYASGNGSHAEGYGTTASGNYSHAEGYQTTASGDWSHAEGNKTIANHQTSHAQGLETIASAPGAHAEGIKTTAKASGSHAEGKGTIAGGNYSHVQGKYNIFNQFKYAHIVGNGDSDTARSNAHTLDWDGNAWFAGNIYIGGTGQNDATAVKVAIVPFPTASDEGKILRVVNGAPTWVALSNAEEASF